MFDADADQDIDLADFAAFQPVYPPPPGMLLVPAGTFLMGDPWNEGDMTERPLHTVFLSSYAIDRYEVTNSRYAETLNWAASEADLITVAEGVVYLLVDGTYFPLCDTIDAYPASRITWDGAAFGVVADGGVHPVTRVSWYGAVSYCNWRSAMEGKPQCYDLFTWECDFSAAGYRLPTEAEWEKAAGWDPAQVRHWRFGEGSDGCGFDCLDAQRANYWGSGDPYESGALRTTPVGFFDGALHHKSDFGWPGGELSYQTQDAQSCFGCYDMSGNVWEWCHDWHGEYSGLPQTNPQGPATGTWRIMRGGGWNYFEFTCRSAHRARTLPARKLETSGFRCAFGVHRPTLRDANDG